MAYLTPEQVIILVFLVGIPVFVFLAIVLAFVARNIKGWGRGLYDWLNARKIGLAVFLLVFMIGIGLLLWSFWTENIALRGIAWFILPAGVFFLVLYLMIPRRTPKVLRK